VLKIQLYEFMYSPPSFTSFRLSPSLLRKEGEISDMQLNTLPLLYEIEKGAGFASRSFGEGLGDEYM
jgi:hypothetical protein